MAVRGFFIISLLALILPCALGTDYCNQSETLCPANWTHADCLPSAASDQCGADHALYVFDPFTSFRIRMLYLVNSIRNTVAGGLYIGANDEYLPKASRMVYMKWDEDLARMAQKITLSCSNTFESICYNTPTYPAAGILNHSSTLLTGTVDPIDIINETISTWEEGSSATSSSDVKSYNANSGNSDFATLITDRNSRIGCSMIELPVNDSHSTFHLVCILSTQSIDGCPIYTQANVSRCGCTFYSRSHPYLCAGGENYDPSACPDKQFCEHQANILCSVDGTHVACVDSSPRYCETISLKSQKIVTILQKINSYRNQTASGGVVDANNENFPTASRTAATTWSRDLSNLAALHAATCPTSKDECHNSMTFSNSGQSIYAASANRSDVTQILKLAVDFWFDQHSSMEPSVVDNYVSNSTFEDFAQLVNERNVKVGCSVSYDNLNSFMYVVCNFAVANSQGCQVYSVGTPASACNTTSLVYSSLCKSTEYNYYVNQAVQYNTDQCV